MKYEVEIANRTLQIELVQSADRVKATVDGKSYEAMLLLPEQNIYTLLIEGRVYEFTIERSTPEGEFTIGISGQTLQGRVIDNKHRRRGQKATVAGAQSLCAPMPGRVVQVMKAPGDAVAAGESVVVVEAMKMQNDISAPKTGTVVAIKVQPGQTVTAGEVLAVVE